MRLTVKTGLFDAWNWTTSDMNVGESSLNVQNLIVELTWWSENCLLLEIWEWQDLRVHQTRCECKWNETRFNWLFSPIRFNYSNGVFIRAGWDFFARVNQYARDTIELRIFSFKTKSSNGDFKNCVLTNLC